MAVMDLDDEGVKRSSFRPMLSRASMDMVGGLVQATRSELEDITHRTLAITQLKRALAGHGYARGAVFGLWSEDAISDQQSTQLHEQLESILTAIHSLAEKAWAVT